MERNHFWMFIGFGLAIGVALQVMKTPRHAPVRLAGFTRFEKLLDEGREVQVAEEPKIIHERPTAAQEPVETQKVEEAAPPAVIAANDAPSTPDDPTATPKDEAKKAEKPKTEEEKKKEAAAKKKADEKKKREKLLKKKALLEAMMGQPWVQPIPEEETKPVEEATAGAAQAPMAGTGFAAPPIAPVDPNALPKTIAEWEAYLMPDASFERTSQFIKLFQTGVVKSDVFYPVVQAMLDDSHLKIHEMAVMALGGTTSAQSFVMLANIVHGNADANLKTQAEVYIDMYERLENLRHLPTAMNGSEEPAQYEAIRVLKTSAERNLKATSPTTQGQAATPVKASTAKFYASFVAVLQQVAVHASDGTVRQAASQTGTELQTLLSNVTATQVAASTTPPTT